METNNPLVSHTNEVESLNEKRVYEIASPPIDTNHSRYRVFVGSVPANTDRYHLLAFIRRYVKVLDLTLAISTKRKDEGKCKGFAFVACENEEDMLNLLELNSRLRYQDRILTFREFQTGKQLESEMVNFKERRIFVGNICPSVTVDDLRELFTKFGVIENVYLVNDEHSSNSKFGYVIMKRKKDADQVLDEMSEISLKGRKLKLDRFKPEARIKPKVNGKNIRNDNLRTTRNDHQRHLENYASHFDEGCQIMKTLATSKYQDKIVIKELDGLGLEKGLFDHQYIKGNNSSKNISTLLNMPFSNISSSETYIERNLLESICANHSCSTNIRLNDAITRRNQLRTHVIKNFNTLLMPETMLRDHFSRSDRPHMLFMNALHNPRENMWRQEKHKSQTDNQLERRL